MVSQGWSQAVQLTLLQPHGKAKLQVLYNLRAVISCEVVSPPVQVEASMLERYSCTQIIRSSLRPDILAPAARRCGFDVEFNEIGSIIS